MMAALAASVARGALVQAAAATAVQQQQEVAAAAAQEEMAVAAAAQEEMAVAAARRWKLLVAEASEVGGSEQAGEGGQSAAATTSVSRNMQTQPGTGQLGSSPCDASSKDVGVSAALLAVSAADVAAIVVSMSQLTGMVTRLEERVTEGFHQLNHRLDALESAVRQHGRQQQQQQGM